MIIKVNPDNIEQRECDAPLMEQAMFGYHSPNSPDS